MSKASMLYIKLGIMILVLSCVSACGQKGDLYLPPKNEASNNTPDFSTTI